MKRYRKSTVLPLILLVYTTAMAIWLLPRNTEISHTEKWITFAASYLIIGLLWLVLRKKEKLQKEREDDLNQNQHG